MRNILESDPTMAPVFSYLANERLWRTAVVERFLGGRLLPIGTDD